MGVTGKEVDGKGGDLQDPETKDRTNSPFSFSRYLHVPEDKDRENDKEGIG